MAQDGPKSSQERPKSAQGAPQESPGAAQEAQETPRVPQERPKSHFGVNLEPPGPHLEAFSETLDLIFELFTPSMLTSLWPPVYLPGCLPLLLPCLQRFHGSAGDHVSAYNLDTIYRGAGK